MRRLVPLSLALALTLLGPADRSSSAVGTETATRSLRILYSSDWAPAGQIYAVDPGRNRVGQVTHGSSGVTSLGACARLRQDTQPPVHCVFVRPLPSRDGRRLVFSQGAVDCLYGPASQNEKALFVSRADGSKPRRLAATRACGVRFLAAWSPDSRRIAYCCDGAGRLRVVDADGSNGRTVAIGGHDPAWSPDGRRLAYADSAGLHVEDERASHLIARGSVAEFAWSPTGMWIAYRIAYTRSDSPGGLYLVRSDGTSTRRIADVGWSLSWSPTAALLAFRGKGGVQIADVNTRKVRVISPDSGYSLAWSPNGRLLAFAEDEGIEVADVDSAATRLLSTDRARELRWAPDGRSLAYVVDEPVRWFYPTGDLRVVTLSGHVRTVVAAAGDYGGSIEGIVWTRPSAEVRYRKPAPRLLGRVTADGVAAPWPIERLATDGSRVAYAACERVFVWTPARGTLLQAEPAASLSPRCTWSVLSGLYSLALSRDRVAFGLDYGGMSRIGWLGGVTLGEGGTFTLGTAAWTSGCISRDYGLGNLAGSESLLVFSRWREDCVPTRTTVEEIRRVEPGGTSRVIASSPGPLVPLDVDADRIVAGGSNATWLLDQDGKLLLSVSVSPLAAQLSGSQLVVLVQGALRVYDAASGQLERTWSLPDVPSGAECRSPSGSSWGCGGPRLVLEDAARGLVTYVLDGQVHVLRLADGVEATIGPGTLARFMDAGLVYADGARLHLVPFDRLPLR